MNVGTLRGGIFACCTLDSVNVNITTLVNKLVKRKFTSA